MPSAEELAEARAIIGMDLVHLDAKNFTVQFAREGVTLDLGAIGKGYAIDRAIEVLRDAGITSALLHGGTSTVYALGHPPDAEYWKVAVENPLHELPRGRTADQVVARRVVAQPESPGQVGDRPAG